MHKSFSCFPGQNLKKVSFDCDLNGVDQHFPNDSLASNKSQVSVLDEICGCNDVITNACFDLDFTEDGECDDSSMMCDIVADEEQEIVG